jgi:hypothetical protein
VRVVSSDDVSARTRVVSVGRNRFVGFEVQVALDGKSELAAHGAKLREADVAEFGAAHSEIAEAEGEVGAFVDFGEKPGALGVGSEELDDGLEVERLILSVDRGALRDAVGEKLFGLCFGDECHGEVPCVSGPQRSGHRDSRTAQGPRKELSNTHQKAEAAKVKGSTGRDSRFGLARPVPVQVLPQEWRRLCNLFPRLFASGRSRR